VPWPYSPATGSLDRERAAGTACPLEPTATATTSASTTP
jgi:hypothetical protein